MIDYLGESNGWPAKGWTQGVFNIDLSPKPNAFFLKSYFKPDEPLVHIAVVEDVSSTIWNDVKMGGQKLTENWNHDSGKPLSLYTYTNADEVELLVNGKSLGRQRNNRNDSKERNRIRWDNVIYSPGVVEALAYNDGFSRPISQHKLFTTGKAVELNSTIDNNDWKADGIDLQHIRIEAIDKNKHTVKAADSQLNFSVEGPAEIIGVINGDMNTNESFTDSTHSLFNGEVTVILRSTPESGKVILTVSSPDFKTKKINLQTN